MLLASKQSTRGGFKMAKNTKDAIEFKSTETRGKVRREFITTMEGIANFSGYVEALRDMGLITEQERKQAIDEFSSKILQ